MLDQSPFPDAVMEQIMNNSVHAFSHNLVMDAVDVSMALNRHLLVYAIEGIFQIETDSASWRLPPSRAGWLPAGSVVKTSTLKPVRCISVFFRDDFIPEPPSENSIFNATLLIQEMFKYTLRWDESNITNNPSSNRFFLTLFDLCREQMQAPPLFTLPKAKSDDLAVVLQYTLDHLADTLKLDDLANLVSMSSRTLTRHFHKEIHMTWRQYLLQARMLRAMDYLAQGMNVTETALSVGFTNISAFITAFHKYTDSTPTQYQAQFL